MRAQEATKAPPAPAPLHRHLDPSRLTAGADSFVVMRMLPKGSPFEMQLVK